MVAFIWFREVIVTSTLSVYVTMIFCGFPMAAPATASTPGSFDSLILPPPVNVQDFLSAASAADTVFAVTLMPNELNQIGFPLYFIVSWPVELAMAHVGDLGNTWSWTIAGIWEGNGGSIPVRVITHVPVSGSEAIDGLEEDGLLSLKREHPANITTAIKTKNIIVFSVYFIRFTSTTQFVSKYFVQVLYLYILMMHSGIQAFNLFDCILHEYLACQIHDMRTYFKSIL